MSNLEPGSEQPVSRAEAIETRAADWLLARHLTENWSEADQQALDGWLSESSDHLLSYWRIEEAWKRGQRLQALRRPMREPRSAKTGRAKSAAIAFAAAGVVVLLAAFWDRDFRQPAVKTYATPIGGHLTLALADGSRIELNTNTILSVSSVASRRTATLVSGEAFFDIRHDAGHPFVVRVGEHSVTDLGTKFVVRNDNARIRVALIEGSARFEAARPSSPSQATDLSPGDVVVATRDSMSVRHESSGDLGKSLGWRRGVLVFDNTTLAEAARELNRYNTEKISIQDPAAASLTIGGTFPENDVLALVNTAKQVFGLKVVRHENEIVISR
jgi:transmembrane sensor